MGLAHAPPLAPRPALIALCLAVFLAPPGGHDDGARASMRPRLGWADAAVVASCPMGDDATLRATKKRLLETKLREEYDKAGFGGSIPFQSWRRGLSADVCQKFQEDVDKMIDSGMDGVITEAAA